jgi:hypothetical protein
VGPTRFFDSHRELLPLVRSSWLMCVVLSDYYLARFKLAQVSTVPSDMGNTCLLQSFSSNSTFIMLYLIHEMDINYLVVDEMINIKIV